MNKFSERAAAALEQLPQDMQERAISLILEEADKLAALRNDIALGLADIEDGRVTPWDPQSFWTQADNIAKAKTE